ncbi:fimbrial protein precursor [Aquitalea magnusonii]|uniref:Fimbrial protein n=1 Tax=Aquitalea magnusonii TaxID=332411 RepID=A0A3G9GL07_9NEIS|nr:fimbrial protein [Aquitalea magnusonii]BBF87473.1 fimbrial protein precursor [Aquitalea magnusonii]
MKHSICRSVGIVLLRNTNYLFILITMSIFIAQTAYATCTGGEVIIRIPDLNFNVNNIPLKGKIGSEIITPEQSLGSCKATGTENPGLAYRTVADQGISSSVIMGKNIYTTSVPGIGYTIGLEPTNFCLGNGIYWVPFVTCKIPVSGKNTMSFNAKLHFQLYRIGTISNATNITIFRNNFGLREYNEWDTTMTLVLTYQSSYPFNMTVNTCSLQSASISNINLPKIYSNALPSINSRAGSTPFSLTINCPNNTNLNITFTDNNKIGQTTNVLTPDATSIAEGVGIQLQYNGKIISFGPDSAEPGATGQIMLNSNLAGTQTFPFTASYIRTGALKAGSLKSTATFTLSYQ